MIGETVGNFEIISRLGKGGMGEVWLAEQKNVKTKVAIKMLDASISTNKTHVQRFFNEAIAVSQIHHAGIVKIFDVGFHSGGQAYLVMEYLQGETLTARIQRQKQLSIPLVADFGRQIASVLDATHGAGITHRDLKPDNIYLVHDAELAGGERVKVLDFGIAKLEVRADGGPRMTSLSVSSIGTPNYMSPEQWHSLAEVDWRTDAYAFGCVAFEMACGRPPFVGESMTDICAMHLSEPPPIPSKLVPGLPPELDELIARLLEKEPERRPTMRDAMTVFTAIGQPYSVGLATLPPGGMRSPLAAQSQPAMQSIPPGASQSLAAAPPPSSSTSGMALAPPKKSRAGLFVLLALLAIAGTVGAVVVKTSGSSTPGPGSAEPGSGSALASKPPPPPDATRAAPAAVADAAVAELAVDAAREPDAEVVAEVVAVIADAAAIGVAADATEVAVIADAAVTREPPDAGPVASNQGSNGISPPKPNLPAKLTGKQMSDGLGKVRGAVMACDRFPLTGRIEVQIAIDGNGNVSAAKLDTPLPELNRCIEKAIKQARFPKTTKGGSTGTSYDFNGPLPY